MLLHNDPYPLRRELRRQAWALRELAQHVAEDLQQPGLADARAMLRRRVLLVGAQPLSAQTVDGLAQPARAPEDRVAAGVGVEIGIGARRWRALELCARRTEPSPARGSTSCEGPGKGGHGASSADGDRGEDDGIGQQKREEPALHAEGAPPRELVGARHAARARPPAGLGADQPEGALGASRRRLRLHGRQRSGASSGAVLRRGRGCGCGCGCGHNRGRRRRRPCWRRRLVDASSFRHHAPVGVLSLQRLLRLLLLLLGILAQRPLQWTDALASSVVSCRFGGHSIPASTEIKDRSITARRFGRVKVQLNARPQFKPRTAGSGVSSFPPRL